MSAQAKKLRIGFIHPDLGIGRFAAHTIASSRYTANN